MKTLLLTGGLGYIGSHNAVLFLEQGYQVIILDNVSNASEETLKSIQAITGKTPIFYSADLRDKEAVRKVFSENTIDAVIHFAGAKAVGESCEKPFYYYENNIVGSLNLFEVMDEAGVKDIVFSSSANVYGPNGVSPFREDALVGDTSNPYGTTKYILERLLRDLSLQRGFRVANMRYFNPIGAHSSGLIGEHANQKLGNILPFLMKVASGQQEYIEVYGDDYDTLDGTGVRDYIHVMDLAQGHLSAMKWLENQKDGTFETYNLGTGKGTSVLELIEMVQQVTGNTVSYKIASRRDIDIATAYCSPEKAEELLGWKTEKTVREGVQDSWNFIKNTSK